MIDRLERRDGGWGIAHRELVWDWNHDAPEAETWMRGLLAPDLSVLRLSGKLPADPIYAPPLTPEHAPGPFGINPHDTAIRLVIVVMRRAGMAGAPWSRRRRWSPCPRLTMSGRRGPGLASDALVSRQAVVTRDLHPPPRAATRLRAVEHAYRTAIERDTVFRPPEPTRACRSPEHAPDREMELE